MEEEAETKKWKCKLGGEDWGLEVRDSASTLDTGPGTGQLGRTGRRLQKQERLRGGGGE